MMEIKNFNDTLAWFVTVLLASILLYYKQLKRYYLIKSTIRDYHPGTELLEEEGRKLFDNRDGDTQTAWLGGWRIYWSQCVGENTTVCSNKQRTTEEIIISNQSSRLVHSR